MDEVRELIDLRHLEDWEGGFQNAKDICSIYVLSPEFIQQMNVKRTWLGRPPRFGNLGLPNLSSLALSEEHSRE